MPIDFWLRGPLRSWAEDLLAPESLRRHGFFAVEPIREKWEEHVSGSRNWQYLLWPVLMFQAWVLGSAPVPRSRLETHAVPR
jgi:asparagine synthase (glutamine-hydrolysing)